MNNVAIAFLTKDRTELSRRTIEPLLHKPFDLFWFDGSKETAGIQLPVDYGFGKGIESRMHWNVVGGADVAIVFALTTMLEHPNRYTHVGLCENDVLLHPDWFGPT